MKRSFLFLLIISLALSLSIPLIYGGLSSLTAITRIPSWGIALLLLMILGSWTFTSIRLKLLCGSLGNFLSFRDAIATVICREFASTATPAGSGGVATLVLLLKRNGVSTAHGAAVLMADGAADLIFFSSVLPIFAYYYFSHYEMEQPAEIITTIFIVIGIVGSIVWAITRHYRPVVLMLGRAIKPVRRLRRLRYRLARGVIQFRNAVHILAKLPLHRLLLILLCSACHWAMRYGVLPMLLWMIQEPVPITYSFLIQPFLFFGGNMLFLPGGGGGIEVAYGLLMQPYLSASVSAFTLLVWRFCTFYWYLIAGAPVFLIYAGNAANMLWRKDKIKSMSVR